MDDALSKKRKLDSSNDEPTKRQRIRKWSGLPPLRIGTDEEDIGRVLHSAGPSSGSLLRQKPRMTTVCMPQVSPVITRQTLKELDLNVILANHQLRHDLLFDSNLQFRPTVSPTKRAQADRYWAAVTREIECGCTCSSFDPDGNPLPTVVCVCKTVAQPAPQQPTIFYSASKKVMTILSPSRIRPLLDELLQVVLSVMQPLPKRKRTKVQHEFENEEAYVKSIFDPALIEQEMKRGVFDPSGLFEQIGIILKGRCAPMRDAAVDAVVAIAKECSPGGTGTTADMVKAVRSCMDLLEYMKLDIANHELQAFRPFIARTSGQFELESFHKRGSSLETTTQWLRTAHASLISRNEYTTLSRNKQLFISIIKGFVDLAFYPPSSPPSPSTPASSYTPHYDTHSSSGYPETTYLDISRLRALAQNATDALRMCLFLHLYRQLTQSSSSARASQDHTRMMMSIKAEIRDIWVADNKTENIILQIVSKSGGIASSSSLTAAASSDDKNALGMANRWAEANLNMNQPSPVNTLLRTRLRDAVFNAALGREDAKVIGLDGMEEEIENLSSRIAKLARIHCDAFLPLYEGQVDDFLSAQ